MNIENNELNKKVESLESKINGLIKTLNEKLGPLGIIGKLENRLERLEKRRQVKLTCCEVMERIISTLKNYLSDEEKKVIFHALDLSFTEEKTEETICEYCSKKIDEFNAFGKGYNGTGGNK